MAHVYVSTVIRAPIDQVWGLIGDFNSLPAWHPFVADCIIEDSLPTGLIGCVRAIEVKDDDTFTVVRSRACPVLGYHKQPKSALIRNNRTGKEGYIKRIHLEVV